METRELGSQGLTVSRGKLRKNRPRMRDDNFETNRALADRVKELTAKKACTPARARVGPVSGQRLRPDPRHEAPEVSGTERGTHEITLDDDEPQRLDQALHPGQRQATGTPTCRRSGTDDPHESPNCFDVDRGAGGPGDRSTRSPRARGRLA